MGNMCKSNPLTADEIKAESLDIKFECSIRFALLIYTAEYDIYQLTKRFHNIDLGKSLGKKPNVKIISEMIEKAESHPELLTENFKNENLLEQLKELERKCKEL